MHPISLSRLKLNMIVGIDKERDIMLTYITVHTYVDTLLNHCISTGEVCNIVQLSGTLGFYFWVE